MAVTFSFGHKLLEAADLRRRHARAAALPPFLSPLLSVLCPPPLFWRGKLHSGDAGEYIKELETFLRTCRE